MGWHQGVVGIVAGRMRERFHRPVIAFANASDNATQLKGSARSIPGLHIRDAIADCAAQQPELIETFGGHAMAAGLTIRRHCLPRFRQAFIDAVARRVSERDLAGVILTDGELPGSELTLANARRIAELGPWGQGFEEPSFHGEFDIVSRRVVGNAHLKLVLKRDDRLVDAIAFNQPLIGEERLRMVYRLGVNDYGGTDTLQLEGLNVEPL
jgi:single-stranded-DNA-specific exonuclease